MRKHHVIAVAILLSEVAFLVWHYPYLPMTDLPEHLLAAKVLTHYNDPITNYSLFFTKHFPWNPYSSYFLFVLGTEAVLGVLAATRLYLTLALVSTILAYWYWTRTVAPGSDAQVIPATLLLFGVFFYIGLINFLFSVPFFFLALALSWKITEYDELPRAKLIALTIAILVTYLSHVVTFGLTLLMMVGQGLLTFRRKRVTRLFVAIVPSALLLAAYLFLRAPDEVIAMTFSYDPFLTRLATLLMPFNIFQNVEGAWIFDRGTIVLWTVALVFVLLGRLMFRRSELDRAASWLMMLLLAATLLLPSNLAGGLGVSLRAAYLFPFALLTWLPHEWDKRIWLRWSMVAVCAVAPVLLGVRLSHFQLEMRDLEGAISAIPGGKAIQPVITEPHSSSFPTYPFLHAATWYNFYKGGTAPYLFASWAGHFPIRLKTRSIPNAPGEWQIQSFRYDLNQEGTDYFLVRTRDPAIISDLRSHVPLAVTSGDWMVFGPNR